MLETPIRDPVEHANIASRPDGRAALGIEVCDAEVVFTVDDNQPRPL